MTATKPPRQKAESYENDPISTKNWINKNQRTVVTFRGSELNTLLKNFGSKPRTYFPAYP